MYADSDWSFSFSCAWSLRSWACTSKLHQRNWDDPDSSWQLSTIENNLEICILQLFYLPSIQDHKFWCQNRTEAYFTIFIAYLLIRVYMLNPSPPKIVKLKYETKKNIQNLCKIRNWTFPVKIINLDKIIAKLEILISHSK